MSFNVFFSSWMYMTYSGLVFNLCFQKQDTDAPSQCRTSGIHLPAGTPTAHEWQAICVKNTTITSSFLSVYSGPRGVSGISPPRCHYGNPAILAAAGRAELPQQQPPRSPLLRARRAHCAGVRRAAGGRGRGCVERGGLRSAQAHCQL